MTTISKCLVVFTAAACIAFLAFVGVTAFGGPNWRAEASELDGYYIDQSEGDSPQWVVLSRDTADQVAGGTVVMPQAIVTARRQIRDEQQAEIDRLDRDLAETETRLNEARQLIEDDVEAFERRESELVAELDELQQQIEQLSNEGIRNSQQAQAVRAEAERRREDVYRLENQLEELRTDKYRAHEQAKRLRDQLIRVGGTVDRLERRKEQLEKSVAGERPYEEEG